MKQVLKVALGVIIGFVVLMVGCAALFSTGVDTATEMETETKVENNSAEAKYEFVEEPKMVEKDYSTYIVGTIKNNSGMEKGYIEVTFTLYDADGNNIGTALANTNNLKDGGTWKFEAIVLEDDVASFELNEITGY